MGPSLRSVAVWTMPFVGAALAMPHFYRFGSMPFSKLMGRDDNDFDAEDLSSMQYMAAIGDSYSAGIGAGDRLCSIANAADAQSGESDDYHNVTEARVPTDKMKQIGLVAATTTLTHI